jgi:hypothetical protein
MGSLVAETEPVAAEEPALAYRSVSKTAITSAILLAPAIPLVLGTVGADGFPLLTVLPIVGLVLAGISLATIRRYPDEYSGKPIAQISGALHALLLVGAIPWHVHVLATEVPEGYQRISFADLQPDPQKGEFGLPQKAFDLAGKPIFIKGYIHPGVQSMGKVDSFVLVPDMGTCCFGGQPKPTDMVRVKIMGDAPKVRWSTRTVRLAGKFAVSLRPTQAGELSDIYYHLEASYVKP